MAMPREQRRKLGAVLVKIKSRAAMLTEEEISIAKALMGMGLADCHGPGPSPAISDPASYMRRVQEAASSYYFRTGAGEAFALRYTEPQLLAGSFLAPGDSPWHERPPWKQIITLGTNPGVVISIFGALGANGLALVLWLMLRFMQSK